MKFLLRMVPKFESADRFKSKEISPTPAIMNLLTSTRHRSKNIQSINFKLYRHKTKDVIQLQGKFYYEILHSF